MRLSVVSLALSFLFIGACGGDDDGSSSEPDGAPGEEDPDAAAEPVEVTITAYNGAVQGDFDWVVAQVGDGDWQVLDGAGGLYRFDADGRWAVYWHCDGTTEFIGAIMATTDEGTEYNIGCSVTGAPDTHIVSGDVIGGGANIKYVDIGSQSDFMGTADSSYQVANLREGTYDLVATIYPDGEPLHDKIIVQHDVGVFNDQTRDLNFTADGEDLTTHSLTADDADDRSARLYTTLGTSATLGASETQYRAVPSSVLEGNDVMEISASRTDAVTDSYVQATRYITDAENLTLELPDDFLSPVVSAPTTSPYVRLEVEFDPPADVSGYVFTGSHEDAGYQILATSGWMGDADSWQFPDFGDVDGWDNAWAVPDGEEVDWMAEYVVTDAPLMEMLNLFPLRRPQASWADTTLKGAYRTGTLTP